MSENNQSIFDAPTSEVAEKKNSKKQIITFSLLGALLVALIVVAILLPSLLQKNEDTDDINNKPVVVLAEEGQYANALLLYPKIQENDISGLEITTKSGEVVKFIRVWDNNTKAYTLRLDGLKLVPCNENVMAYLVSYVATTISDTPLRDVTKEEMKEYCVTEDTCYASFKITFDHDGKSKTATVRIGDKVASSNNLTYVSVDGRNVVYLLQTGAASEMGLPPFSVFLDAKRVDYLDPIIYGRYSNADKALFGVENFNVFTTKYQDEDGDGKLDMKNIVSVLSFDESKEGAYFNLIYKREGDNNTYRALANNTYLRSIFEVLYTTFTGESVVEIVTEQTKLSDYGLDIGQESYFINATFYADKENGISAGSYNLRLSKEINGYHYALSNIYDPDTTLVIKVPKSKITFLNTEDKNFLNNYIDKTVTAGFYEYLAKDEDAGKPGLYKMILRTKDGIDETFYIDYNTETGYLKVDTSSGKKFYDIEGADTYQKNQFANLYTILLLFPSPRGLNTMTERELSEIMVKENIAYELIAQRNDGTLIRYTYYQINANLAVGEVCEGKLNDTTEEWGEGQVLFNVTMEQLRVATNSIKDLLDGKEIRPDKIIY